jgi:alginate O-acetyltransferase complex protein AlgI
MVDYKYFVLIVVSLVAYWLIPRQFLRNWLLMLSSTVFLYSVDKWSIVVVSLMTVWSWVFGVLMFRSERVKSLYHLIGVSGLVVALIMFKYLGFVSRAFSGLLDPTNGLIFIDIDKIIIPLGISYMVFKYISYLTDVKWKLVPPGRLDHLYLYASLFTIFVAGPIERYERFAPQIEGKRIPFNWSNLDKGFSRIVVGLFKKVVIADWLGYFAAPVWAEPWRFSSGTGLLALLAYSFQIYYDFSGYSDIAIGSSRLFGLRIMENFNKPYLATNISQFWRRWHISLSDWIKDYIFFPLSSVSSNKLWSIFLVPMIAMGLCGLWHGASWHYLLWGFWHGFGLFVYQLWSNYTKKRNKRALNSSSILLQLIAIITNFTFVSIGWLLFR